MSSRFDPAQRGADSEIDDLAAADSWEDIPDRVRSEVERRPYVALLAAGGVGCLLARGLPVRLLPRLVDIGLRLAIAAVLPALARAASLPSAPER